MDRRKALRKMKEAREESAVEPAPTAAPDAPLSNTLGFGSTDAPEPLVEIDCPRCAERIKAKAKECRFCGQVIGESVRPSKSKIKAKVGSQALTTVSSPGTAAVLAFFVPGLGHIYCGKIAFGLGYMASVPVVFFLGTLLGVAGAVKSGTGAAGVGGTFVAAYAGAIAIWVWQIVDAYNSASKPR